VASATLFNDIWRGQFSDLKIPKYNTLGACGTCTSLKEERMLLKKGSDEWRDKDNEFKLHLKGFTSG
jgi:hypothetical protein